MLLPSHFYGNLPLFQAIPSQGKSEGFDSCGWPSNLTQIGLKSSINQLVWPWNLMNDLEKQWGTSSILHQILCIISNPLVNSKWRTIRKCSIRVKIGNLLSRVNLIFDGWPWKIIGHIFYTTLSFVQHVKAIGIFKLELQFGNAQFGSKFAFFLSRVTLKIDVWPLKPIRHLSYATWTFVHNFIANG